MKDVRFGKGRRLSLPLRCWRRLLLGWPGFAPQAHAATVASAKTHFVEISVDVDEALKPYPGLFDNCAAEGKSYAAAMRAQAEKEHREDPSAFRDGMAWTYDRGYALRSAVGRYVSIVRSDDTFEGGAHPNHMTRYHSLGHRRRRSASRSGRSSPRPPTTARP